MTKVAAPVKGFSGVVANVEFVDGAGETDDPTALAYFKRHGYSVEERKPVVEKKAPVKKAASRPPTK